MTYQSPKITQIIDQLSLLNASYIEQRGEGVNSLASASVTYDEKYGDWQIRLSEESFFVYNWVKDQQRQRAIGGTVENHAAGSAEGMNFYDYRLTFREEDADGVEAAVTKTLENFEPVAASYIERQNYTPYIPG